jgi:hypothetical protein
MGMAARGNPPASSPRTRGPIPRDLSIRHSANTFRPTTSGGYGFLLSQERHLCISNSPIHGHGFAISPRLRARFAVEFPPSAIRGCRECRAPDAPAAARGVVVNTRVSHHGHTGITRHSPRDGFTAYSALSSVTGLSCHRPPRNAKHCRELMPASGHQDHTTSPSARRALVSTPSCVHRIPPRVRDDRETPLLSRRDGASW